jgi:FkbM family methyltransferase
VLTQGAGFTSVFPTVGAVTFSLDLRLVEALKKALPLEVFVETGTFEGETLASVQGLFRQCYSVELSAARAEQARARFGPESRVHIEQGSSPDFLKKLAPKVAGESVLFWLDAHWCAAAGTAGEASQCPLLEELGAIGSLNKQSLILIDDARLFLAPPPAPHEISQWPRLHQVLDALRSLSPVHSVIVVNDVIAFFPKTITEAFEAFAHTHGINWLEVIHGAGLERELRKTIEHLDQQIAKEKAAKSELKAQLKAAKQKVKKLRQAAEKKRGWWPFRNRPKNQPIDPEPERAAAKTASSQPRSATERDVLDDLPGLASDTPIETIFDVGANEGQTVLRLVDAFPNARIHSFEPFPEAFAKLQQSCVRHPRVHTHQVAFGERDGSTTLFLSHASVTNSLLPTSAQAAEFSPPGWTEPAGKIEVPIAKLDTFCAARRIERIDLLKIDTQGYELQVLQGASAMLAGRRVRFVYLELIFVPLYERQTSFDEVFALLRQHGYLLVDLYEKNVGAGGALQWCNALFRTPAAV